MTKFDWACLIALLISAGACANTTFHTYPDNLFLGSMATVACVGVAVALCIRRFKENKSGNDQR